jgi:DNA-binding response OmpR family regulator
LRRHAKPASPSTASPIVTFGPFQLDMQAHTLQRQGENIPLTTAEFTLLRVFVLHPGKVLSRDQLASLVQADERMPFDRSIDTRVARLRRRIEPDAQEPVYIRTVWGAGYLFAPHGRET